MQLNRFTVPVVLSAALVLAACNGNGTDNDGVDESPTESAESGTDGPDEQGGQDGDDEPVEPGDELPEVAGSYGEDPTLDFPETGAPADLEVEVLEDGDGDEVGTDDLVYAHYHGQVWDGEVFDSSFERGAPTVFSLNQVITGWKEGLTGTNIGDRVLLSIPSDQGYGDQGQPPIIDGGDTLVFVVDVVDSWGPDEYGDPEAADTDELDGLPVTVDGELGEHPSINVEDSADEPDDLDVTVIASGDGEEVSDTEGSFAIIQYSATSWDGSMTESTTDFGGASNVDIGAGTVFDNLVGVPAGSRAVMLVPGMDADPSVPGMEEQPAMAVVVDVVATVAGE